MAESLSIFRLQDYFSPELRKIMGMNDRFKKQMGDIDQNTAGVFSRMRARMGGLGEKGGQVVEGLSAQMPQLAGIGPAIANPYVAAGAAVAGLGVAYVKATGMAVQWNTEMAKANVTLQQTPGRLAEISAQIRQIAANNANDFFTAPEAFNRLVSGGLSEATALASLDPVLKAAKAGFADVGTTAEATIGVMNSTGIQDARKVLDVLFATLNKGNAEFKDVAQYLPTIIPSAKQVGITFEETAGAFAYYTAQGMRSERASTVLMNVFKVLGDADKAKLFKKIGIDLYDANGRMKPLVETTESLRKVLGGLSQENQAKVLGSLGLDMEAASGISSLIQNTGKLKEIIDFTRDSQGQLNTAIQMAETPMDVWRIIGNQVKAAMVDLGQTGLPVIKAIGTGILDTINYFRNLWRESALFRDIISGIGNVISIAFTVAMTGPRMLWNIIKGIGDIIGWVAARVGIGTGSFTSMYNTVRPYLTWIWELLSKIGGVFQNLREGNFKGAWESIKNFQMPDMAQIRKQLAADRAAAIKGTDPDPDPVGAAPPPGGGNRPLNQQLKDAVGSGSTGAGSGSGGEKRNVTVSIGKLVESVTIQVTNVTGQWNLSDFKRMLTEALVSAVHDSEQAL